MNPARDKWWDDVVSSDVAHYYGTEAHAVRAVEKAAEGKSSRTGRRGSLIWGDRVRILERKTSQGVAKISARGQDFQDMWVRLDQLGGEPLLELYVIDVGQGDGLLVVTPEGHHLVVDGGDLRRRQQSGKNAADFIDWKFYRDYLSRGERSDADKTAIRIDALVASHCDQDHFGGLLDLMDLEEPKNAAELKCSGVKVESVYHAGLCWWVTRRVQADGKVKLGRTLGPASKGHYTRLLNSRSAALDATERLDDPDTDTLSGSWGRFVRAATRTKRGSGAPSALRRISTATGDYLPGFEPGDGSVSIRVLGPIETDVDGQPGLAKFPDGDSKNTNGHSVVLRLDYKDRRLLLTGDLNTHSQNLIMDHFGAWGFLDEFRCDVAKGCHHGSHDVSMRFLDGLRPLATIISSGDAETHDHPRPSIVSASAITGRRLIEGDSLAAPLIYMTELARSIAIKKIDKLAEFTEGRPEYESSRPKGVKKHHDTPEEMAKYRLFLGSSQKSAFDWPRIDKAKVVRGIRYGLINVRTDGRRLFFAQMEESGDDWAIATLSPEQIAAAR